MKVSDGAAIPVGLAAGFLLDAIVGDPRRGHPVAGFGRIALMVEQRMYRDRRRAGLMHAAILAGGATVLTASVSHRISPQARGVMTALVTAMALGGTSLRRAARDLGDRLRRGDLDAARSQLPTLCGRDPSQLDEAALTRAVVESVAENTSDAVVGTLLWGAIAGPAGVVLHRTFNTLDAMVGYRTRRYRHFGWAAARGDDILNFVPARVTAALMVLLAPLVRGRPRAAAAAWVRDARGHPSPNAGPVEAATAGALGVRLGGAVNRYGDHVDRRPALGDGRPPTPDDIDRAVHLSAATSAAALGLGVLLAAARGARK